MLTTAREGPIPLDPSGKAADAARAAPALSGPVSFDATSGLGGATPETARAELYFSIVQRKALTPNDFDSLEALTERLLRFGQHYRQLAQPFDWTFTRTDLEQLLARIDNHQPQLRLAA